MNRLFIALTLVTLSAAAQSSQPGDGLSASVSGKATAIDVDTLRLENGMEIALFGVDALKADQQCTRSGVCTACGGEALAFVRDLVESTDVSCVLTGGKDRELFIAACSAAGRDVGEALISAGWALAYPDYLGGTPVASKYTRAEESARRSGLGMHRKTLHLGCEGKAVGSDNKGDNPGEGPLVLERPGR
jgi:endonuclease YncB( thermonuclease family)